MVCTANHICALVGVPHRWSPAHSPKLFLKLIPPGLLCYALATSIVEQIHADRILRSVLTTFYFTSECGFSTICCQLQRPCHLQ